MYYIIVITRARNRFPSVVRRIVRNSYNNIMYIKVDSDDSATIGVMSNVVNVEDVRILLYYYTYGAACAAPSSYTYIK